MIKNSLKTNLKGCRGITLIALVVSIIVLLILAGVSISAITGNESAMEKAKEAREKNEQGAELDAIKLAVVSAMSKGTYGMAEAKNLKTELAGLVTSTDVIPDNSAGPWTVEAKNSKIQYIITPSGEVTAKSDIVITAGPVEILQGAISNLSVTTLSNDLSNETITWHSSDTSKATVAGNGKNATVIAVAKGTTKITATAGGNTSNECTINVVQPMSSVEGATASGYVGSEITITLPENTESIASYELLTGASTYLEINNSKLYGKEVTPSGTTAQVKVIGNSEAYTTVSVTVTEPQEEEVVLGEVDTSTNATTNKTYVEMFGWDVNYESRDGKKDWKLFYRDDTNTYIISDSLISSTAPKNSTNYNSLATGASIGNVGRGLNPMVVEYFVEENDWDNLKGTAYFTKISNWTKYTDTTGNALFAIACPTVELFQKSYNATHIGGNQITLSKGTTGYTENTNSNWLKTSDNFGIYNKDGVSIWWIASPHYNYASRCLSVDASNNYFASRELNNAYSIRPLVCIPNLNFDIHYSIIQPQS